MTREVLITIEGLQMSEEQDLVTTKAAGVYHYRNGKHFIHYEESVVEGDGMIKNAVKIASNQIDITKKGSTSTRMVFVNNEKTVTEYQTPFGSLELGIHTTSMQIVEAIDEITVKLCYSLDVNNSFVSNNDIVIKISSI